MRDEVQRDLNKSSADFIRVVWPALQDHCRELRGSELRMVEGQTNDALSHDLDVCAGIDAYHRRAYTMRGITSRVQWRINYQTFTIRLSRPNGALTEYHKRLTTLKHRDEGFLYPYWTIQAYLTEHGGELLSVAVAKTAELYLYIEQCEKNGYCFPRHPAGNGGEWFLAVEWERYRQSGNYLFVYPERVPPG